MARGGIPSQVIKHFEAIPLFGSVSKKSLRAIVSAATEVDVKAGRVLVKEGGFDRDLFVITRGEARVSRGDRKLATLGVGDFFGELAFLDRAARSATVTAATDMRVMVLGPREMDVVLAREPVLAKSLLEAMAKRVRNNERSLQL
jgi:CRP/FNR family transcriptional regulator, cyclic AMP receptor protein